MRVNKNFEKLLEKYKEISILGKILATLDWDMNVNLPREAATGRAAQIAYLTEVLTDKWLDPEFRSLLIKTQQSNLTSNQKAMLRNLAWVGKYYFKVPKEIIVEKARTTTQAFMIWQEAKKQNKFRDFLPSLRKIVNLNQIIARHLGFKDNPYDALLDLFEPGLTTSTCAKIFGKLQPVLIDLLDKIKKSRIYKEQGNADNNKLVYPSNDQRQLALFILRKMNYDLDSGRMDVSSHPFENHLGRYDIRITNRYNEVDFHGSLLTAMHEGGHALYEQGVNPAYDQTPLETGVSLGIHESQSRFWENQVGRNSEFLKFMTPIFQAFYPEQLTKVGSETITKLFNTAEPSLIRTESDEVTYNLHIILRFELEEALINNKLKVDDLPGAWQAKMKKYLGVVPITDREGVLQDVHWSLGSFGYFPTYTLGNLYASQFTHKMREGLDLDELVGRGELGTILGWLREHVHQHGSLYWPEELSKRITGEKLNPKYFLSYISKKYGQIYNL